MMVTSLVNCNVMHNIVLYCTWLYVALNWFLLLYLNFELKVILYFGFLFYYRRDWIIWKMGKVSSDCVYDYVLLYTLSMSVLEISFLNMTGIPFFYFLSYFFMLCYFLLYLNLLLLMQNHNGNSIYVLRNINKMLGTEEQNTRKPCLSHKIQEEIKNC